MGFFRAISLIIWDIMDNKKAVRGAGRKKGMPVINTTEFNHSLPRRRLCDRVSVLFLITVLWGSR